MSINFRGGNSSRKMRMTKSSDCNSRSQASQVVLKDVPWTHLEYLWKFVLTECIVKHIHLPMDHLTTEQIKQVHRLQNYIFNWTYAFRSMIISFDQFCVWSCVLLPYNGVKFSDPKTAIRKSYLSPFRRLLTYLIVLHHKADYLEFELPSPTLSTQYDLSKGYMKWPWWRCIPFPIYSWLLIFLLPFIGSWNQGEFVTGWCNGTIPSPSIYRAEVE